MSVTGLSLPRQGMSADEEGVVVRCVAPLPRRSRSMWRMAVGELTLRGIMTKIDSFDR